MLEFVIPADAIEEEPAINIAGPPERVAASDLCHLHTTWFPRRPIQDPFT